MHGVLKMVGDLALMVLSIIVAIEVGRHVGIWRHSRGGPHPSEKGLGAIEGAIFGLMGLLLAFTFSGAASRFDARRQLVGQETNAMRTVYLRIDLLPSGTQAALREDLRKYVDARLEIFRDLGTDRAASHAASQRSTALQNKIWSEAVDACAQQSSTAVTTLVLSSINEMIDVTTMRSVSLLTHPPRVIYLALGLLVLISSLLAGYGMASVNGRSWLHMLAYSAILSGSVYMILEIEYPREGFVRVDNVDQVLVHLRDEMK